MNPNRAFTFDNKLFQTVLPMTVSSTGHFCFVFKMLRSEVNAMSASPDELFGQFCASQKVKKIERNVFALLDTVSLWTFEGCLGMSFTLQCKSMLQITVNVYSRLRQPLSLPIFTLHTSCIHSALGLMSRGGIEEG